MRRGIRWMRKLKGEHAAENIRHFHEQQVHRDLSSRPGIVMGQRYTPSNGGI